MKKIICALLSLFLITPCIANIHINSEVVKQVINKYFPNQKEAAYREYLNQLKLSGVGITPQKIWYVCVGAGLDIWNKPSDTEHCRAFVKELVNKSHHEFRSVCGEDSKIVGAVCVEKFYDLKMTKLQARGLAKLYALHKYDDESLVCAKKPRIRYVLGQEHGQYLRCVSNDQKYYYEFNFSDMDGNIDSRNQLHLKKGICRIFDAEYDVIDEVHDHDVDPFDICKGIKNDKQCKQMNSKVIKAKLGYWTYWGWSGSDLRGYKVTKDQAPYCVLEDDHSHNLDWNEKWKVSTAFGLDGFVFVKADVQRKAGREVTAQILTYVQNTMGKENVKSFKCEDNYRNEKVWGYDDELAVLICYVNGEQVDFFFKDLSESWNMYNNAGREAMNCIIEGGTYSGKQCVGLDEKGCNVVRNANKKQCPECEQITWNPETKTCDLPAGTDVTNLKRGLTYTAIVAGAVVTVVVTIATFGAGTAPTALVVVGMTTELTGAAIELQAQHAIYEKTDNFFKEANGCNNQNCAEELIKKYLQALSNQQNDMLDVEIQAADTVFTQLFDLIPADSQFYKDILTEGIKGKTLKSNEYGLFDARSWNSEQVWRAVGIALQIIPSMTSVIKGIFMKTNKLTKSTAKLYDKLDDASRYIDDGMTNATVLTKKEDIRQVKALGNSARVAQQNIVDFDKLSDIDKEWYKLWKEYAPANQTFDDFKAMADGDLDKMKEMVKSMRGRSQRNELLQDARVEQYTSEWVYKDAEERLNNLKKKYNIDKIPDEESARKELFKQYPDLETTYKEFEISRLRKTSADINYNELYNGNTPSYSTFDPEYSKLVHKYDDPLDEWWYAEFNKRYNAFLKDNPQGGRFLNSKAYQEFIDEYQERWTTAARAFNFEAAEKFPLKNLGNVVNDRLDQYRKVLETNPSYRMFLDNWDKLTQEQQIQVLNEIGSGLKTQNGLSHVPISLKSFDNDAVAHYTHDPETGLGKIEFNKNSYGLSEEPINTYVHENEHNMVDNAPNSTAVGSQYAAGGKKFYSSDPENGYRLTHNEQSSYKIGDMVGKELRNEGGGSFDNDIKELRNLRLNQIAVPAAVISTAGISFGTGYVGSKIIDDNKNKKKDNKTFEEFLQEQEDNK